MALFFSIIDPFYGQVKELNEEVLAYKGALDDSMELQRIKETLVQEYKAITKENKDSLNHLLPSTIDNIGLILEVEKIANLHGMPISNIKFEAKNLEEKDPSEANKDTGNVVVAKKNPSENLPYGVFPMEFIIEGRYSDFVSFLKDLEYNLRLIDIKSISFETPENKTTSKSDNNFDPNIYSYTLKAQIYWLK